MNGYTLLEMVVVIGIVGLITSITLTAWPTVRQHQALFLAEQQIQSIFRQAEQLALHEERSEDCLSLFSDAEDQKLCSDVGVAVRNQEMVIFADTISDNKYSEQDFHISRLNISTGASFVSTDWRSHLFKATPPNITLYGPDGIVVPVGSHSTVTIKINNFNQQLDILPYGQVQLSEN